MITKANIKLTPAEWCELAQVDILDPDGWNFNASYGVKSRPFSYPITWIEFVDRTNASTIRLPFNANNVELVVFGRLFLS